MSARHALTGLLRELPASAATDRNGATDRIPVE
jgi:hypothetical protein